MNPLISNLDRSKVVRSIELLGYPCSGKSTLSISLDKNSIYKVITVAPEYFGILANPIFGRLYAFIRMPLISILAYFLSLQVAIKSRNLFAPRYVLTLQRSLLISQTSSYPCIVEESAFHVLWVIFVDGLSESKLVHFLLDKLIRMMYDGSMKIVFLNIPKPMLLSRIVNRSKPSSRFSSSSRLNVSRILNRDWLYPFIMQTLYEIAPLNIVKISFNECNNIESVISFL